jgi:hypothetical protein
MKRVAAVFATLPLLLAACGAAETASRPKPADEQVAVRGQVPFVQQAGRICAGMKGSASLVGGGRKPTDAQVKRLLTRWRAGFNRLGRLDPPRIRAKAFRQMLTHYRTMTRAFAAALAADDESVLSDFVVAFVEGTRGSRAARGAGLAACAFFPEIKQPPRDPEQALAATRALVPAGSRVVKADTRECNVNSSCRFDFRGKGSPAARLREAKAALRAHGWTHIRTGRSPTGSSWAMAYRNDYEVSIELLGSPRPQYCAGRAAETFGCSDSVWVHRVEIPQVLTGG